MKTEKPSYLQPLKEAARQSEVVDWKERQTEHFVTMQGDLVHTTPHRILYTHAHARNAQLENRSMHARHGRRERGASSLTELTRDTVACTKGESVTMKRRQPLCCNTSTTDCRAFTSRSASHCLPVGLQRATARRSHSVRTQIVGQLLAFLPSSACQPPSTTTTTTTTTSKQHAACARQTQPRRPKAVRTSVKSVWVQH